MFKETFLLMIMAHVIGEFYIANSIDKEKKKQKLKWFILYELLYGCTFLLICIPVMSIKVVCLSGCIAIFHLVIDSIIWLYERKGKTDLFVIKQIIIAGGIVGASYYGVKCGMVLKCIPIVNDFFDTVNVSEVMLCKWVLGLLIIHKPANQLIQMLLPNFKPQAGEKVSQSNGDRNIGRVIGTIERAIMLLLIYMNQYAAIGLVLTAKSIARYDKIAKEKDFAEYYLLGTLISLGIVVACGVMLF